LVERLVRNEKVRGSNPLGSTSLHKIFPEKQFQNHFKFLQMQPRHFEAIIFSAKAAVAAVIGALCYKLFDLPGAPWVAAVSAVLVTQPNLHSSFQASFMRVIANLAGAFGGAVLLVVIGQPIAAMAIGVMVTGLLCYLLKQDDALRPAFVAVIIVTLIGENSKWQNSLDRVIAVIVGCICALAVGFLFDKLADALKLFRQDDGKKPDHSE
jgi:uncharacterized membrane protein YgaE (UPF0421/DUF939 family)